MNKEDCQCAAQYLGHSAHAEGCPLDNSVKAPCNVRHYGECDREYGNSNIRFTLNQHDVMHFTEKGIVYVYESATVTKNGVTEDASEWIPAPTTIHALAEWLGY